MTHNFSTKLGPKGATVDGIAAALGIVDTNDIDFEIETPSILVEWSVSMDIKEWGIKSVDTSVNRVVACIEWSVNTELIDDATKAILIKAGGKDRTTSIDGELEIDSTVAFNGKEWEVINKIEPIDFGYCSPDIVEINFYTMTIEVS